MTIRTMSLRRFLVLELVALGAALGGLLWMSHHAARSSRHFLEHCAAAQKQAVIAARLDADVGALAVARATRQPDRQERAAVLATMRDYAAATVEEAHLMDDHPEMRSHTDIEQAEIDGLSALVRRIVERPDLPAAATRDLRRAVHDIALREQAEVDENAQAMAAMQAWVHRTGLAIAAGAILLAGIVGLLLWRLVALPLRALDHATGRLMEDHAVATVPVHGIVELRRLAARFNDMAQEIERQVSSRTAELRKRNDQLAEIDRTRRLFFAKVGHELRTPLTVIRGEAEVALRPAAGTEVQREALGHIVANSDFLQRRLDDLLATARSVDGTIQLAMARTDLAGVVRSAVAFADPFARSSDIALDLRIDADELIVMGDESWLRQALLAIIDNGVKFAGDDGRVAVAVDRRGNRAVVRIGDTGAGASPDMLRRLFEPYFQGESGVGRGGAGLGLALARWIVDRHNGVIEADNLSGAGLMITIELPLLP